ncbi:unnamed protein product [Rhizophagus irregularis]|nr:unnamed protein product [Rhizophagus irregularis]
MDSSCESGCCNKSKYRILQFQQLIGTTYIHPIREKQCKIIDVSHITKESGTGLVHIAPDHGMEDYEACKKFDIPTSCPVDEFGIFTFEVSEPTFEAQYRLEQFTLSRSEWCISHRRSWGVPIPIFYESETDVPLLTDSSVEYIIEIFKNMDQMDGGSLMIKNYLHLNIKIM